MSFWDSSALVPLCTNEPRSILVGRLWKTFPAKFKMKAADSLQLAAALIWCKEKPKGKDFVAGDEHLIKIAQNAGFNTHLL